MKTEDDNCIAQALAPEDIRSGDYVSILHMVGEFLPCIDESPWRPIEPVRVLLLPWSVSPMKVVEVCLPYVLIRGMDGKHHTLDTRRYRLARVSKEFGRKAFKRFQKESLTTSR